MRVKVWLQAATRPKIDQYDIQFALRKHPRKAARVLELQEASKRAKMFKNIGKTDNFTVEDVQEGLMATTEVFPEDAVALDSAEATLAAGAEAGVAGGVHLAASGAQHHGLAPAGDDDFDEELDEVL